MSTTINEQLLDVARKMQSLVTDALKESRGLTEFENGRLEELKSEATRLQELKEKADRSADLVSRLTAASPEAPSGGLEDWMWQDSPTSSAKNGGSRWAKTVMGTMTKAASSVGVKALLTGEITTPPAVTVSPLPAVPTRLLDLIPREGLGEHTFEYLRQVVATNNADVVADNALKPTSVYTFESVEDRARVIAHLSEPFPLRYATDHTSMLQVLDSQMLTGVYEAIERLIVSGTGLGEEWEGILTITGTTAVPFATDVVTTLRKARTAQELKGERVTAVAMHPTDIEALDLLREDGATGGFLLDTDAYERILGPGVQGVPSVAVPVGTAILGDWSQTRLRVREAAQTLAATQAGDLFDKNQMKLRSEGRYGFQLFRPQALAVVDLAA